MAYVDDVLYEFDGQLTYTEVISMTYKELGYLRKHRKKHHPREADIMAKSLMGMAGAGGGAPQRQKPPPIPRQR